MRTQNGGVRRSALFGLLLLVLLAVGWGGVALLVDDRVPRGTTVLGVDIGGRPAAEARELLRTSLAERATEPVAVMVGERALEVDPAGAGLSLDVDATVEATGARRSLSPARLWKAAFGGDAQPPVTVVEGGALVSAVADLAEEVDQEPSTADVVFEGSRPQVVQPVDGLALEQAESVQEIADAYLSTDGPVSLPTRATAPETSKRQAQSAFESLAVPAVSGPVTVGVGNDDFDVPVDAIAAVLDFEPADNGDLLLQVDEEALEEQVRPLAGRIDQPAKDASIELGDNGPRVVPSRTGVAVDVQDLAAKLADVLPRDDQARRTLRAGTTVVKPEFTTAEAKQLGIKEVVSEFTTRYPYAAYRVTNIGRAAEKIDETLLLPGDEFSLNGIVGERTAENGFAKGTIIKNGRFAEELGGGVSQVATTTFNAMFFAGLKDVQHKPHSFFISRYPEGREATVAWPTVDLRFINDTPYGVLVDTSHVRGSSLTVRMWSTKHREVTSTTSGRYAYRGFDTINDPSSTCVPQGGVSGFQVDVTRTIKEKGKKTRKETFHTVYNPADSISCRPEPDPEPPAASTAGSTG